MIFQFFNLLDDRLLRHLAGARQGGESPVRDRQQATHEVRMAGTQNPDVRPSGCGATKAVREPVAGLSAVTVLSPRLGTPGHKDTSRYRAAGQATAGVTGVERRDA